VTDTSPLGEYILNLCYENNLLMREASIRAGLGTETIGVIIRRGKTTTPRPDTLRAIADTLGGSFEHMMQLAGHLPEPPDPTKDPELRRLADELLNIWRRVKDTDPEAMRRLERIVITQAEAFEAAVRGAARREEEEEDENEMSRRE